MYKPEYGHPTVAMRIPRPMIVAAKICARRHGVTLSELMRDCLAQQLDQDGIPWQTPPAPTPGQKSIDDYLDA